MNYGRKNHVLYSRSFTHEKEIPVRFQLRLNETTEASERFLLFYGLEEFVNDSSVARRVLGSAS